MVYLMQLPRNCFECHGPLRDKLCLDCGIQYCLGELIGPIEERLCFTTYKPKAFFKVDRPDEFVSLTFGEGY